MVSSPQQVYARLVAPVKGKIILAVILTITSAICNFMPYVAIARVAQMALVGGMPSMEELLFWIIAAVAGAIAGRFLFAIATGICHFADADFRVSTRTVLIKHLGKVPLGWFSVNSSAQAKQGATDDVLNMHQSVGHAPVDVTLAVLTPVLPLLYLFFADWRIALILIGFLVLSLFISAPFIFKDFERLNTDYNTQLVEVSSAVVEMIDGITVVKTFGTASRASKRYHDAVARLTKVCYVWTKQTANPTSVLFAIYSPATMLVFLLAVSLLFVSNGWASLSQCIPFLVLGVGVPSSFIAIFQAFRFLQQSMQGAKHLGTILDIEPLKEPNNPSMVASTDLSVEFNDLSFSYEVNGTLALADIDVVLKPNTVTALVGSSGSGKTTFARLIPRFWDPATGSINFNKVDLREMMTSHVLSRVAIVFQETVLLRETIRDNIRLGRLEATEEAVIAAAKNAQIHERIIELPNGYDTVVGSDDGNLSGGEMQRVAIARAMLQDAPILVLDEATAHADPENETAIQQALSNLAEGRTTVVIAHRLNTITNADQILVLDRGMIIEQGTHEELLEKQGRYAMLWASQQIEGDVK